ncbi:hypothetical protein MRB53_038311 [Persea americana]|nr:hypothetical protein MRB53_038311 [Persea americana]
MSSPLFEIQSIAGKGKGLVASVRIAKGTRILVEAPLIIVQNMPPEILEPIAASKLRLLSKEKQRQFLALHNNFPGKNPFSGIIKTNALPCGPRSVKGGVYPTICLINHSCLPNAHNNWNEEKRHLTIHAIGNISAGQEITISYDQGGPSIVRQRKLKQAFGFDCDCNVCSLPPTELRASDARRVQIQTLDGAIGDPHTMANAPRAAISNCHSLLETLHQEFSDRPGALIPRLYYDAFQISVAHGDLSRASVFAERAYIARVACEGEDSPVTSRMKKLTKNPAGHASFRAYSMRYQSKPGSAPKELNQLEFESWLWTLGGRQ